jgi:hypothetical protein
MRTRRRYGPFPAATLMVVAAACMALAAPALAKQAGQYTERDLVSDVPGAAELLDPLLVNPWGWPSLRPAARRGWPITAPTCRPCTPGQSGIRR